MEGRKGVSEEHVGQRIIRVLASMISLTLESWRFFGMEQRGSPWMVQRKR